MNSRRMKFCFVATSSLFALMLVACTPNAKTPAANTNPSPAPASASDAPASLFTGTSLAGWHSVGSGNWSVEGGAIVGHSQQKPGGWLFLDHGYQDFVIDASFQCDSDCSSGALLRGTKVGDGLSGIYIPLGGNDMGKLYRAHIGSDNAITSSTQLPGPPPGGPAQGIGEGACDPYPCAGIRGAKGGSLNPGSVHRPLDPIHLNPTGWNKLEITMRGDVLIATINGTRLAGAQMDNAPLYGQIALQVGGTSTVKFKDVTIYDLTQRVAGLADPYVSPDFRKQQLSDGFYSESVSVGDINHDGHMDVVSGPFYYAGPDFNIAREIYAPETAAWASSQSGLPEQSGTPGMGLLPAKDGPPQAQAGAIVHGFYSTNFLSWVYDFNGDGWPDVLAIMGFGARPTFTAHIFINPKGEKRSWDNYTISPVVADEFDSLVDIDGDGKPELIMRGAKNPDWTDAQVGILKPDWADVTKPWKFTPISEPGKWGGHGGGVGDINGDGKPDLVNGEGWWEHPANGTDGLWKYHKQRFGVDATSCGPGCGGAETSIYDVNGDGLADVVTSLAAHGPGLVWYEQQRSSQGDITWKRHLIMGAATVPMSERNDWEETDKSVAFTELHALSFADMNGDGLQDVVTGKRWWSHGIRYEENEVSDPPVIYWFELRRKENKQVQWVPHMIDNTSGVGTQMVAVDVNGDGRPDVVAAARKGTFLFFNNLKH